MDETKVTAGRELALYIALTHKQEEIDKRKHEAGPWPGITTPRAFLLPAEKEEEDKWKQPERIPTEDEKKMILAIGDRKSGWSRNG